MLEVYKRKKTTITWFKPEITAVLYINSPAKLPHLIVVKRLYNFSKNRILENWTQNCDIKCHLCWSEEKK